MIESRTITDRETWLAWRKADVTASTIGALFGVHPYSTALRLYAEKRGTEFQDPDNAVMRRGRWLEPAVAEAVRDYRPEWKLNRPNLYVHDTDARLGCTPDFFIVGDPRGVGVLQCKTVAPSVYEREWSKGTEIPLWVTLQTLTEMMLTESAFGAVAVLLVDPHNMDVAILDVPRHPPSEEKIKTAVANFWQRVANGLEPDPDFARDADVIKALSPKPTPGKHIDFSGHNELPSLLAERADIMAMVKTAETRRDAIDSQIKWLMGDAEIGNGLPDWRITYKMQHRTGYTVPTRDVRVLLITDKREAS